LSGLTDGSGNSIISYSYDSAGRLSGEIKGNATYSTYTYDAAGEIVSLVNYAPDDTVNSSFVYTYDDLGLCTTMTTVDGQWVYTYDAIGQLTHAVFTPNSTDPDGLTSQDLQYFYDSAGNRTKTISNGVVTTYLTNDRNEYTSATTISAGITTYQYDGNGNLISQTDGGSTIDFTYNVNNQLTGVQRSGSIMYKLQYDAFGDLYTVTRNGESTRYLTNPLAGNVIAQFSHSNLLAHYTYGLGLASQVNTTGVSTYYDFDELGSTVGMTNAAGSYVNKCEPTADRSSFSDS
jgi:YD repeat-containing protein